MVAEERAEYETARSQFSAFLESKNLRLGSVSGWQNFVRLSARSSDGRRAMLAYRRYRKVALGTTAKLRVLEDLLKKHPRDRMLIFTNDNETVYTISEQFLIPAITHQTRTKERREILKAFNEGDILALVTSRVLNEGVNVPEANVAVVLSGTSTIREHVQRLGRILRRREGKYAILYEVISRNTVEDRISRRRRQHDAYDGKQREMFERRLLCISKISLLRLNACLLSTFTAATRRSGEPDLLTRCVSRPPAQRWRIILCLTAVHQRARTLVEFGTSHGYSTLHLAAAAQHTGGRVFTLDQVPEKTAAAQGNLRAAGLDHLVECHTSTGDVFISALPDCVDFVFVDFGLQAFAPMFDMLESRLAPGAFLFVDGWSAVEQWYMDPDWAAFKSPSGTIPPII